MSKFTLLLCFVMALIYKMKCKVTTLDFSISGTDFYMDFMKPENVLHIRSGCKDWPLYKQFDTNNVDERIAKITLQSQMLSHNSYGKEEMTLDDFVFTSSFGRKFDLNVTKGYPAVSENVYVPVMLLSCQPLYYAFKNTGSVMLEGFKTKTAEASQRTKCFESHTFYSILQGDIRIKIMGENSEKLKLKSGDTIYFPPNTCGSFSSKGIVLSLVMTWTQGEIKDLKCKAVTLNLNVSDTALPEITKDDVVGPKTLKSGFKMPPIGFGTARLFKHSYQSVLKALQIGYRLIDTAQLYEGTESTSSEEEIGKAIRDSKVPREDIFIVTKLHPDVKTKEQTTEAVEKSLKALGVDYLDAVLMHSVFDEDTCDENDYCQLGLWESWSELENLQKNNKIRSLGVSNLEDLSQLMEVHSRVKDTLEIVQNYFDPLYQGKVVREFCKDNGIVFMGYSALGYLWIDDVQGMGMKYNPVLENPLLRTLGRETDIAPATAVLRWAMDRNVVVMPSTKNPDHMEANFYSQTLHVPSNMLDIIDGMDNTFTEEDTYMPFEKFKEQFKVSEEFIQKRLYPEIADDRTYIDDVKEETKESTEENTKQEELKKDEL